MEIAYIISALWIGIVIGAVTGATAMTQLTKSKEPK